MCKGGLWTLNGLEWQLPCTWSWSAAAQSTVPVMKLSVFNLGGKGT